VQETKVEPGSTIFLYTDGLTEAKRARNQLFGINYTEKVLTKCAVDQLMPREILETLTQEVHRFVGNAKQSDDLTMLAIRYMPKQFKSTMEETLLLKNNVQEVTRLSSFIKSVTEKLGIEKSLARQLRLAVEEAVVNVIDYAYPAGTEGDITVKFMSNGQVLRFQIIDSGVAFDPTAKEKADTTLSVEDRQIGGLGILLVRELMDSINYERENGKNILTLIKNLKQ
jgi:sigma-B regulation protein RsbU (phosphoserine phosphatase)